MKFEIFSSMHRVMGFFVTRLTIDVASAEIYFLQFCQNSVDFLFYDQHLFADLDLSLN